jgi:C-terminal processing protease CtpA/Prc
MIVRIRVLLIVLVVALAGCVEKPPPAGALFADRVLAAMDSGLYATGEAWRIARAQAVASTRDSQTPEDALAPLRSALATAGRSHSSLYKNLEGSPSQAPSQAATPAVKANSARIGVVQVPELYGGDASVAQEYARSLSSGIKDAAQAGACGWIIDLRGNTGGDMRPMLAGLTPLLPNGVVGSTEARDGARTHITVTDGTVRVGSELAFSEEEPTKVPGPVAILVDAYTASSAEFVAIAFIGLDNTRSFGSHSMGYSTGNVAFRIDSYTLVLTVGVDADRNGTAYPAGVGPDVRVARNMDAAAAAANWLSERCA